MDKLLKQRVEILAQEVEKMKSGGAGEGYTKAEADAKFLSKDDAATALAGKQNKLDQTQLAAVNSGIDSTKVAQIETNKTNILYAINMGVKNLFNPIDEFSGSSTISTINNGDGTYKITGGSNFASVQYASFFLKAGTYVLSGCPENGSDNTYRLELRTESSTAATIIDYGTGATAIIENSGYYLMTIRLAANYTAPSSGLLFKPMICEKSVWDSTNHDFQPPALPNTDLTKVINKTVIKSESIANADLNGISETGFALYVTPANLPSGTSGNAFVRTSVYDENTALQELTLAATGASYIRVKASGTWGTWAQTTNT